MKTIDKKVFNTEDSSKAKLKNILLDNPVSHHLLSKRATSKKTSTLSALIELKATKNKKIDLLHS